ncbi:MAG: cupin domain-containing protein [Steroidobacteraceae bacterium]
MSRSPDDDVGLSQDLQDSLAAAVRPAELGAEQRDRLRRRTLELAREQPPEGTSTLRGSDGAWIEIAPFVEVRELRRDEAAGMHTSLMRMRPGGMIPAHRHEREEEFIILEGECYIGTHRLVAGDVHIAAAGSWHEPVTTESGVVVLLRGEYPHPTPAT